MVINTCQYAVEGNPERDSAGGRFTQANRGGKSVVKYPDDISSQNCFYLAYTSRKRGKNPVQEFTSSKENITAGYTIWAEGGTMDVGNAHFLKSGSAVKVA